MITLKELNPKGYTLTPEQSSNLNELHRKVNVLRRAYGKPMYVSSGVRSLDLHKRIYEEKARKQGLKDFRIPMGSRHLTGEAVDFADQDGTLKVWIRENVNLLEEIGLWCEDLSYTPTWLHVQSVPPRSGRRFFIP